MGDWWGDGGGRLVDEGNGGGMVDGWMEDWMRGLVDRTEQQINQSFMLIPSPMLASDASDASESEKPML